MANTIFRGNLPAKIDAQGRIKIPVGHRSQFLEGLGPDVFITSIDGESARIYPLSEWEKIEEKLLEPPRMLSQKQRFMRATSYWGQEGKIDKQGRVLIQPHLRESAGLDEAEVAVIGNLSYLEVWNRERVVAVLREGPFTDEDAGTLAELNI